MNAVDTNILVRFIVADDEEQANTVHRYFMEIQEQKEMLFVPGQVLIELVWVLKALYHFSRADIIEAVEAMAGMPILNFYDIDEVAEFIQIGRKSNIDLADLLIGIAAKHRDCGHVITFDRKAVKSGLFSLIENPSQKSGG